MPKRIMAISLVYVPTSNTWVLLRDNFYGEYPTFSELIVALAKASWFEGWN